MDIQKVGDTILRLVGNYHNAVGILHSEILSDSLFDLKLTDYGFNCHSIQCGINTARCGDTMNDSADCYGILANTGSRCLHVLKQVPEHNGDIFHILFDEKAFVAEIFTENDIADFVSMYSEVNFLPCLRSDPTYKNRLLFNSCEAQKCVQKYAGNLAVVRPHMLFAVNVENSKANISQPLANIGADMQGMKSDCAVYFSKMPTFLEQCLLTKENMSWPEKETIEQLLNCGIYFVPSREHESFWEPEFCDLESCLVKAMQPNSRKSLEYMRGLSEVIAQLSSLKMSTVQTIISHSVYWHLSENCHCQTAKNNNLLMEHILCFMCKNLSQKKLCHYFIPQVNLLKQVPENDCMKLSEVFQSLQTNPELLKELLIDSDISQTLVEIVKGRSIKEQENFLKKILASVECSVSTAFMNTVKLMQLKLFQKLNQDGNIDSCVREHQKMLLLLTDRSENGKTIEMCKKFVSGGLANLYFQKAQFCSKYSGSQPTDMSEVDRLVMKAEELFRNCKDITGTVKLANLYFMTNKYSDCCNLTKEILTSITERKGRKIPNIQHEAYISFSTSFLQMADGCFQHDVLLSKSETKCMPSFVGRNITLTASPLVGITSTPVYTLRSEIFARFLLAMSLFHLGKTSDALSELDDLEGICSVEEFDCNEKRTVAYYNILANCYIATGNKEHATKAFMKSLALIPSPANPARFALFSMNRFNAKQLVQKGIILTVGIAMIGVTFSALKSKW